MKEGTSFPHQMIVLLLAVVAVETIVIAFLGCFVRKRFKKFKRAEQNFTRYLDILDRTNERLKSKLKKT